MSRDQRWTGSTANREWQRGTTIQAPIDGPAILAAVKQYLADCRQHAAMLSPNYHPTEAGALKVIFHRGPREADAIGQAYRHLTGQS